MISPLKADAGLRQVIVHVIIQHMCLHKVGVKHVKRLK